MLIVDVDLLYYKSKLKCMMQHFSSFVGLESLDEAYI